MTSAEKKRVRKAEIFPGFLFGPESGIIFTQLRSDPNFVASSTNRRFQIVRLIRLELGQMFSL